MDVSRHSNSNPMKIELKKFGTTLSSRPAGKEAYASFLPSLKEIDANETIEIDFEGIGSLSPSWADEFLTPLRDQFQDHLILLPTDNLSAQVTIQLLEDISQKTFKKK